MRKWYKYKKRARKVLSFRKRQGALFLMFCTKEGTEIQEKGKNPGDKICAIFIYLNDLKAQQVV